MLSIRTVLCPVDLSPVTARQMAMATDVCRAFGARLTVHHNFMELAVGSGVGWMWAVDHTAFERDVEQRLLALVPRDVPADVRVTRGAVAESVLAVGQSVGADLVVLSTRGAAAGLDGSVTERVLERATIPVLAIHDASDEPRTLRFSTAPGDRQLVLVPTDLTPSSQPALGVAFDLARRFDVDIELLHVLPGNGRTTEAWTADEAWSRLVNMVPPDVERRVHGRVERGVPARVIADAAHQRGAACIVMGEHARTPLRHWLRPDTSLDVLHPSPCPIWYVPGQGRRDDDARPQPAPTLVDELGSGMFHYWPTHGLYGVVDSRDEAESTLVDLLRAGVPKDLLQTWHGPAGHAAIDPTGEKHGRAARWWRTLEQATPERGLLERYATEVERGRVCIGVRCGAGQGRQVVVDILQRHGGHLLSFFTVGSVERVAP
jgi:nucleotide-binding universal stress UspA family protein